MFLRIKKISKFYKYILFSILVVFIFSLFFIVLIYFFPIKSTSNMKNYKVSKFISPWPVSSLDNENQERKRLKRYAKVEQKKRLERQFKKMNILSTPIYDLSLDDEAEVFANSSKYYPDKADILWPILPTSKKFTNPTNLNASQRMLDILLPTKNWTSIFEGVYLGAGDEIKANIPIIKDKRYLNFIVFPLIPGNLRVILGQYVWAKTFNEEDVHKNQKIFIPINDPTTTNIRILSISCSCYIEDLSINQNLKNGREPIKVTLASTMWKYNPKNLLSTKNEENTVLSDDDTDMTDQDISNTDETDDDKIEPPKAIPEPSHAAISKPILDVDPLLETSNPQILTNAKYTTAFGYNVIFIQGPQINTDFLNNINLMKKVAPNLYNLMSTGTFFNNNIRVLSNSNNIFRQTIYQNYSEMYNKNIELFQYKIEHNDAENNYQKFRRYGYKVVSITSPSSLFYTHDLINNNIFSNLYNRWLDYHDWEFENNNMKIDDKAETSSGLDAIFNLNNSKKIKPPLNKNDYLEISKYFSELSQNINRSPNWHPNEYMLISNKNFYTAKAISAFQSWTESYLQSRFFAHILLDSQTLNEKPTLTNLKKSIFYGDAFSLLHPKLIKTISRLSYFDMGIGEVLNTVKANRIENRTLIFILIPSSKNDLLSSGIYKIPGLIGKKLKDSQVNLKDIMSTLFSNVGIPTGNNLINSNQKNEGNMIETSDYTPNSIEKLKTESQFLKYTILLKSNKNLCSPIIWKSNTSSIFGIQSSYPVYRIIDSNTLEIFPCSISNKVVELNWYQTIDNKNLDDDKSNNSIGGRFLYFKNKKDFPEIFFGKDLTSYNDFYFLFKNITPEKSKNIFYVGESNLSKIIEDTKESLSAFDNISNEKNSKFAFFITPL